MPRTPLTGFRFLRKLAGYGVIGLMILIILTGNYTFFNILTIFLSISVFNDEGKVASGPDQILTSRPDLPFAKTTRTHKSWGFRRITEFLLGLSGVLALGLGTMHFFGLRFLFDGYNSRIESKVMFSKEEFTVFVTYSMCVGIALGAVFLVLTALSAVARALSSPWRLVAIRLSVVVTKM